MFVRRAVLALVLVAAPAFAQAPAPGPAPAPPPAPVACEDQLLGAQFGQGQLMEVNGRLQQQLAELRAQHRQTLKERDEARAELAKTSGAAAPRPEGPR